MIETISPNIVFKTDRHFLLIHQVRLSNLHCLDGGINSLSPSAKLDLISAKTTATTSMAGNFWVIQHLIKKFSCLPN